MRSQVEGVDWRSGTERYVSVSMMPQRQMIVDACERCDEKMKIKIMVKIMMMMGWDRDAEEEAKTFVSTVILSL